MHLPELIADLEPNKARDVDRTVCVARMRSCHCGKVQAQTVCRSAPGYVRLLSVADQPLHPPQAFQSRFRNRPTLAQSGAPPHIVRQKLGSRDSHLAWPEDWGNYRAHSSTPGPYECTAAKCCATQPWKSATGLSANRLVANNTTCTLGSDAASISFWVER